MQVRGSKFTETVKIISHKQQEMTREHGTCIFFSKNDLIYLFTSMSTSYMVFYTESLFICKIR